MEMKHWKSNLKIDVYSEMIEWRIFCLVNQYFSLTESFHSLKTSGNISLQLMNLFSHELKMIHISNVREHFKMIRFWTLKFRSKMQDLSEEKILHFIKIFHVLEKRLNSSLDLRKTFSIFVRLMKNMCYFFHSTIGEEEIYFKIVFDNEKCHLFSHMISIPIN